MRTPSIKALREIFGDNNRGGIGVNQYPNNANYVAGFQDGDYARIYKPVYDEPEYLGSNDMTDGYI